MRIKYLISIAFALMAMALGNAKTYTVDQVPNVQVTDHTKHLSNPDGIISPATATQIDTLLADARRVSSAELAVVVVDDIDPEDVDDFATSLFNKWNIGKSDKNNGILMVVANDSHQAVIRTGYGAEGVLPDVLAGRIIYDVMFPRFRQGDMDGGVLAGVKEMHRLVTNPDAVAELMSKEADRRVEDDDIDPFKFYIVLCCLLAIGMLAVLVGKVISVRGFTDYEKYAKLIGLKSGYLALTFVGLFIPLVASLPLMLLLSYWRNRPRKCTACGTRMRKLDEVTDNAYLTPSQDLEEQLKSVDYDVWLCPKCGETAVFPYINHSSIYSQCPNCHARTAKLTAVREIKHPTVTSDGIGEKDYTCLNCHNVNRYRYQIPKKEVPVVVAGPGRRGGFGGGSFGGGSFGGGFGGGFTGGGGASGRW